MDASLLTRHFDAAGRDIEGRDTGATASQEDAQAAEPTAVLDDPLIANITKKVSYSGKQWIPGAVRGEILIGSEWLHLPGRVVRICVPFRLLDLEAPCRLGQ